MIATNKDSNFSIIAVPAHKISYKKTEHGANITLYVPDLYEVQEPQPSQYYVLKRPNSIDDDAFQIALEAAFCILAKLNNLPSNQTTASSTQSTNIKHQTVLPINTDRLEQLKKDMLNDSEWLPANIVSRRGGSGAEVKNPSGLANRWKRTKKIFAVTIDGKDLYPAYALDIGGQPLPLIKKIIELFGETKTPWALAAWFGSPNSWLNNAKPKDLLTSNPKRVLEAAQRSKEGPIHG